jgi:hypothetical protein
LTLLRFHGDKSRSGGRTEGSRIVSVIANSSTQRGAEHVRLVYHYRDGHDFTTEVMLRAQAVAYMPVLQASPVDAEHYEATFAAIELLTA